MVISVNDILERHAKSDFAAVHDLIPQYAQHIVDRISNNDRIDDLKTEIKDFLGGKVTTSQRFDLFGNWMIKSKGLSYGDVTRTIKVVGEIFNRTMEQLAIEIVNKQYIYMDSSAKDKFQPYTASMRLRDEDIIIRAIAWNSPFDDYVRFILSNRHNKDELYSTPYTIQAIKMSSVEALNYFLENGIKVSHDDLYCVVHSGKDKIRMPEILDILVQNGLNIRDSRYDRHFFEIKNVDVMRWFLANRDDEINENMLFRVIIKENIAVAKFIMNEHLDKIDINAKNEKGNTFLHGSIACGSGLRHVNLELFSFLIDKGIDYSAKNSDGNDAEAILRKMENESAKRCLDYLIAYRENKALNSLLDSSEELCEDFLSGL